MGFQKLMMTCISKLLTGDRDFVLERKVPSLEDRFQSIEELGLYLHIPFCRQICPYCPYNKELFDPDTARHYAAAVNHEVDLYSRWVGSRPVTSFYVGGGTPTSMLNHGLDRILEHIYRVFNMYCAVHMESHPNDLSPANLDVIRSMGVEFLSIGVEALQDRHLRLLRRTYTADEARAAVRRAAARGFRCVNLDFIFALPGQTYEEVEQAGKELVRMGADQVTTYPLFTFPHTPWADLSRSRGHENIGVLTRRKMLAILEGIFHGAGFERSSVWAFTRSGVPKYCSVTVPLYLGLGASGASYLRDVLYFNTFKVREYISAIRAGESPIALSMELSERMQMAGWLYWRVYETKFRKADFRLRFGREFDSVYGRFMQLLAHGGLLVNERDEVVLTSAGAYWLHALQDLFSIGYIGKLWRRGVQEPWPERVVL
jgi:oxygen-independent coproporphyrinogen-3 oxidase